MDQSKRYAGKQIEVLPNDNPKEREDRTGRVRVSNKRTWVLVVDGEMWDEYKTQAAAVAAADNMRRDKSLGQSKVIAVDFNRTLVSDGGSDPSRWGSPEPDAKWAMDKLKEAGFTICINSVVGDKQALADWLTRNQMPFDHINESPAQPEGSNPAKINAVAYIDDRAVPYRGDWKESLGDLFASGILTKRHRKTKKSWEVCNAYCTCPNCRESECEQCLQNLGAGAAKLDTTERKRKGLEKAPCKPGQNTHNSDCTPASGGGSGGKKPVGGPQEAMETSEVLQFGNGKQEAAFRKIEDKLGNVQTVTDDGDENGTITTTVMGKDGKPVGKITHNTDGTLLVDPAVTKLTGIKASDSPHFQAAGPVEYDTAAGKVVGEAFDSLAGLVGKGAAAFDKVMSTIGSVGNGIAYAASDEGLSAAKNMLAKWLGDKADQLGDKVEGYANGLAHMLDQAKQTTSANVKDAWKETLKGVAKVIAAAGGKSHVSDSEIDKGLGDWLRQTMTAGPIYVKEVQPSQWYVFQGSNPSVMGNYLSGPHGSKKEALDRAAEEVRDQRRNDPGVRLVAAGEPDVEKSLGSLLDDPDFQVLVDLHKNGDDFGQAATDVRRVLAGKHDMSVDAVDAHAAIRKAGLAAGGCRQSKAYYPTDWDDADLKEFAKEVNEWARDGLSERESRAPDHDPSSGFGSGGKGQRGARFGNKVFIGYVALLMGMPKSQFREMLLAANQRNLVELSRADLVQVMHPDDVRQSETDAGVAQFHFIRPKSYSKGALLYGELAKMPDSHIRGLYAKYGDGSSHSRDDMIEELSNHRIVSIIYFGVPGKSKGASMKVNKDAHYVKSQTVPARFLKWDDESNSADFVISTEEVDRDGDTLDMDGLDVSEYKGNPVVCLNHDTDDIAIGRADDPQTGELMIRKEEVDGKPALVSRVYFNMEDDKARRVANAVKGGFMRAASVSFDPVEDGTEKNRFGGSHYRKWKLIEWSVVTVPANAQAVRHVRAMCKSLGVKMVTKAKAVFDMVGGREMAEKLVQQLPSQGLKGTLPPDSMSGPVGGWVHVEGPEDKIQAAVAKLRPHLRDTDPYIEKSGFDDPDEMLPDEFRKGGAKDQDLIRLVVDLNGGYWGDAKVEELQGRTVFVTTTNGQIRQWELPERVGYRNGRYFIKDEKSLSKSAAYDEGFDARNRGAGKESCPYADDPDKAEWLQGWESGEVSKADVSKSPNVGQKVTINSPYGGKYHGDQAEVLAIHGDKAELRILSGPYKGDEILTGWAGLKTYSKGRKPGKESKVKRKLYINRAWPKKGIVLKADLPSGEVDEEIAEYLDDNGVTDVTVADEPPPVEEYAEVVEGEDKGFLQPGHAGVKLGVQPRGSGFMLVDQDGDESRETFASVDEARAAAPQYGSLKSDDGGKTKGDATQPRSSSNPVSREEFTAEVVNQLNKQGLDGAALAKDPGHGQFIYTSFATNAMPQAVAGKIAQREGKSNGGAGVSKSDDEIVEAMAEKYDSKMDDDQLDKLMDEQQVPEEKRYRLAKRLKSFSSKTGFKALDKWIKAIEDDLAEVEQSDVLGAAEKALKLLRSAKAKAYPEAAEIATKAEEAIGDVPEEEAVAKEDAAVEEAMEAADVPEEKRWALKRMVKSILFEKRFEKAERGELKAGDTVEVGFGYSGPLRGKTGTVVDPEPTTSGGVRVMIDGKEELINLNGLEKKSYVSKRLSKADEECVSGLEEEMKSMASGTDLPKHLKGTVGGWAEKLANLKRKAEAPVPETMELPPEELSKIKAIEEETEKMRKTWKDLSMTMFGN